MQNYYTGKLAQPVRVTIKISKDSVFESRYLYFHLIIDGAKLKCRPIQSV